MTAQTADWTKFWDMVSDTRFGMFTARAASGHLHSRPMTTLNGKDDRGNVLWFFMSKSSKPVLEIGSNPEVNVAYGKPESDSYVSVSGTASIVEDMAKKKAFWSPMVQAWFGSDATNPDVALVSVAIEHAEYWNVRENKATQLFEMAKAAMTGTRPNIGEHGEIRAR
jgi:general stress protein 26